MSEERVSLAPKILELNENLNSNDIYMTLKLILLTTNVNLNNAQFEEDFIDGVVNNKDFFNGIPLVVNRIKLENQVYDSLSHEYSDGELKTDIIGSFVSFEKTANDDGSFSLIGESRIQKRFPQTCAAIIDLYNKSELSFSCEVLVREYASIENGVRKIGYANGSNILIAQCLVSDPAEIQSKPTLLVASYEKDLELNNSTQEGGHNVEKVFNNGFKIKNHGEISLSQLSFDDIESNIWNQLNPDNEDGSWTFRYSIEDCYPDYVVVESVDGDLFKVTYTVNESDDVVLAPQDQWVQVENTYTPVATPEPTPATSATPVDDMPMKQMMEENSSLKIETEKLKAEIASLKKVKTEVEVKDETMLKLNEQINLLKEEVASFAPVKTEYEKLQEEKRVTELNAKRENLKTLALNSKLITEQELAEVEELKLALEEVNEQKVKDVIIERLTKNVSVETSENQNITVHVKETEDLLPQNARARMFESVKRN